MTTVDRMVNEPLSHLSEAVRAIRIGLELSNANPKVVLITSALPDEGKSTAAMLLAASSANSGKRTILLDCDLRLRSTSEALRNKHKLGLSEVLRGTAELRDVIKQDPRTKIYVIPAGSVAPNAADLLMSQRMLDLIAVLRDEFDYIVMDAPPLAAGRGCAGPRDRRRQDFGGGRVVPDVACQHPEAFKVLGPEANRVAGFILNKVDFNQLPGYGYRRGYGSAGKYLKKLATARRRPGAEKRRGDSMEEEFLG